jgi:hypothetical protein
LKPAQASGLHIYRSGISKAQNYQENPRPHYALRLLSCVFAFGRLNSGRSQCLPKTTVSGNPAPNTKFLSSHCVPELRFLI